MPDPDSLYFYGASRWGSGVEVPAQDQDFYALKNVPHGQLRRTLFYSKSADAVLQCFVYTPPDYDKDPARRYPVLYLQHGGGENETGWGQQGFTGRIMDNLIADGKARPFIIVMANSYVPGANMPGRGPAPVAATNATAAAGTTNSRPAQAGGPGGRRFDFSAFTKMLTEDLIPYIDANFRTLADQPNRAMAGLSMGGMQTRSITLANLDKFSHIGIFSGGSIGTNDITDLDGFQAEGEARVRRLRQSRNWRQPSRRQSRWFRRRSQGERGNAQSRRHQQRLVCVARDRARMAILAAQPVSVRAVGVPELSVTVTLQNLAKL